MRRDDFALCRAQILIDRDKLDAVNDDTIPLQMLQVLYLLIANNCSKNGFRDSKNDEKSYSPIIIIQKQMCHKKDTALTFLCFYVF